MKKSLLLLGCTLFSGIVSAGGFDLEFCGYKVFNFGFDVNPFSRDDGRSNGVHVVSHTPQYYVPPQPRHSVTQTSVPKDKKTRNITIRNSSNVTVNCYETQQTARPVYTSNTYTTYPVTYSYAYPVTYSYVYPVSYVQPRWYYPYSYGCYRPYCYRPCWNRCPYYR